MATSYSNEEILAIVNTINQQINATADFWTRCSWGVSRKAATVVNGMPALAMRVSGLYHKGWVYICYGGGADTYEIHLVSVGGVVKKVIKDVYCDMLSETIDINIERGVTSEAVYAKRAAADSARKFNR